MKAIKNNTPFVILLLFIFSCKYSVSEKPLIGSIETNKDQYYKDSVLNRFVLKAFEYWPTKMEEARLLKNNELLYLHNIIINELDSNRFQEKLFLKSIYLIGLKLYYIELKEECISYEIRTVNKIYDDIVYYMFEKQSRYFIYDKVSKNMVLKKQPDQNNVEQIRAKDFYLFLKDSTYIVNDTFYKPTFDSISNAYKDCYD